MPSERVSTKCPKCQKTLRVELQLVGEAVRCPACREKFTVTSVSFSEVTAEDEQDSKNGGVSGKRRGPRRGPQDSPHTPGNAIVSEPRPSGSGRPHPTLKMGTVPLGNADLSGTDHLLERDSPLFQPSLEALATQMNSAGSAETFGGAAGSAGASPFRGQQPATGSLGRFELHEVLGRGGFGVVYRAYDPLLDRQLALKMPLFASTEGKRAQRFLNEAKAAAKLRHPNIVAVYESGEVDGKLYLAAEFVQGQTLADTLKKSPPSFEQAVEWVKELAGALAYAHSQGIVHRDIKPQNVMIGQNGRPQIMDFGLAKRLDQDSKMTSEGALLGTPAYMSPEQARGDLDNVGPASDQYSLGVVLYELLTKRRPFDGPPAVVIANAASEDPPAPCQLNPDIPKDLEAVCQKAMEKDPARRYANAIAFAADLANWQQGESTTARPFSTIQRFKRWVRRSPAVAALTLAVAALLSVAAAISVGAVIMVSQSNREVENKVKIADAQTRKAVEQATKAQAAILAAKAETEKAEQVTMRFGDAKKRYDEALARFEKAKKERLAKDEEVAAKKAELDEATKRAARAENLKRIFDKHLSDLPDEKPDEKK